MSEKESGLNIDVGSKGMNLLNEQAVMIEKEGRDKVLWLCGHCGLSNLSTVDKNTKPGQIRPPCKNEGCVPQRIGTRAPKVDKETQSRVRILTERGTVANMHEILAVWPSTRNFGRAKTAHVRVNDMLKERGSDWTKSLMNQAIKDEAAVENVARWVEMKKELLGLELPAVDHGPSVPLKPRYCFCEELAKMGIDMSDRKCKACHDAKTWTEKKVTKIHPHQSSCTGCWLDPSNNLKHVKCEWCIFKRPFEARRDLEYRAIDKRLKAEEMTMHEARDEHWLIQDGYEHKVSEAWKAEKEAQRDHSDYEEQQSRYSDDWEEEYYQ